MARLFVPEQALTYYGDLSPQLAKTWANKANESYRNIQAISNRIFGIWERAIDIANRHIDKVKQREITNP